MLFLSSLSSLQTQALCSFVQIVVTVVKKHLSFSPICLCGSDGFLNFDSNFIEAWSHLNEKECFYSLTQWIGNTFDKLWSKIYFKRERKNFRFTGLYLMILIVLMRLNVNLYCKTWLQLFQKMYLLLSLLDLGGLEGVTKYGPIWTILLFTIFESSWQGFVSFLPLCYVSWQEVTHPPPTTFTTKKCGWTYSKKLLLHKMHDCKEKEEKKQWQKNNIYLDTTLLTLSFYPFLPDFPLSVVLKNPVWVPPEYI